jgi:hypothetical protein
LTKFYYDHLYWNTSRNEINFVGAFLGNGRGKRWQLEGTKRNVPNNRCLYLCKIQVMVGKHKDFTFKLLVIEDSDLKNWNKDDIQIVGKNLRGHFLLDADFASSMVKNSRMEKVDKIKLSDMEYEKKKHP